MPEEFSPDIAAARSAASPAAAQKTDARFFRSLLLLAAAVSLAVGAFWWALMLRKVAEPIVQLRDAGDDWVVGTDGRLHLSRELPEPLQQLVATTLRTGKLAIPDEVRTLAAPPTEDTPEFRALVPVATVVRNGRPSFRWTPAANAGAYRVTVIDAQRRGTAATGEAPAGATEWTPSDSLQPAADYAWEVEAMRDGALIAKTTTVRFRVLDETQAAQLDADRAAAGSSHLAVGIVHARAGLLDEAVDEFRLLLDENPRSGLAQQLLEQVAVREPPQRGKRVR